ncbi:hypothetical protein GWJ01_04895 [Proteus sp. G2618]|uniref:hypothetical protein n=1 Tax=Proteus TaxID=583 RepID=UPI001376E9F0|nr:MULTISPECIES: hypothetical protein [Proteus]MBG5949188.1 hypothetical protein [Proteus terrae]NBN70441.1 hypothetical protein [Proteus sp. G2618]
MNINSIFRDTVNQLTTGAGKAINSVIDFFSSLRSGITGLFNSNTSFRQAATDLSLINYNDPKKTSLGNLKDFLNEKCGMNTTEDQVNGEIDNIENDIYEGGNIYEEMNNKEDPIYYEINEDILDLIGKLLESRNENKSPAIEDEYSIVIDCVNIPSEEIYSDPYEAPLSDGNIRNTLPTGNKNMELLSSSPKDKTKFNTI